MNKDLDKINDKTKYLKRKITFLFKQIKIHKYKNAQIFEANLRLRKVYLLYKYAVSLLMFYKLATSLLNLDRNGKYKLLAKYKAFNYLKLFYEH